MKIRRLSDSEFSATVVEPVTEPMSVVQTAILLLMTAGLIVFALFWAMLWAGLAVEPPDAREPGVALTAAGVSFIGER